MPSLTIHFIQDESITGDVQLSKLQWLLKTRTTPLERYKLKGKDTGRGEYKIQWNNPRSFNGGRGIRVNWEAIDTDSKNPESHIVPNL